MRTAGAVGVLLLGALAACAPGDTWSSRVEEPDVIHDNPDISSKDTIFRYTLPPPPLEALFRKPADFRIFDPHLRKEFFLYMYEDDGVREEVITVINYALPQKDRRQNPATPDEAEIAMALFIADWRSRGQQDRIQYFNRKNAEEQYRKETQIDDQIVHMTQERKWWDEQVLNLESDLLSRKNTSTFSGGDEKLQLSDTAKAEALLSHAKRKLAIAEAKLLILEYRRAIRDSQYSRGEVIFVDSVTPVADLLPFYQAPERLVDEIRSRVQPFAWAQSEVRIYIAEGKLVVHHTRDMAQRVRDYVTQLRADYQVKQQQQQIAPGPAKK